MSAVADRIWELRNVLVENAKKDAQTDDEDATIAIIDLGIRMISDLHSISISMEKLAKSQEEIASSIRDLATRKD